MVKPSRTIAFYSLGTICAICWLTGAALFLLYGGPIESTP